MGLLSRNKGPGRSEWLSVQKIHNGYLVAVYGERENISFSKDDEELVKAIQREVRFLNEQLKLPVLEPKAPKP